MACRDGRPLLVVDVAVPRDVDPGVARGPRRHAARHRRPEGLRRALGRAPARRDRQGPRDPRRRDRALPRRPRRRARSRRSSRRCASSAKTCARGELERFRAKLAQLDPTQRDAGRGAHAGHRQQAAARADRAGEGRGRHAARRATTPTRSRRCSTCPSDRGLVRAPHRDARRARSRAGRRSASARCSARAGRVRGRHDDRRPRPDAPTCTRSAARACSSRRCSRPCSTAAPTSRCTRPRICRRRRRPGSCSRRFPSAATRATRSSGATLDELPTGGARSAPARCAAARSSRRRAPTSRSARCAATSRPACASAPTMGYDAVVVAVAALERLGLADRGDRGARPVGDAAAGRRRARSRVECRADDARDARAAARRSTTPVAHRAVDAERAFLAELGGGCNLPCGALARVDGRRHDRARRAARVARRPHRAAHARRRRPTRSTSAPRPRAICSTARAAARCSTWRSSRDRVPRRRRARAIPGCSPCAARSCCGAPTSSSTTGSRRRALLELAPAGAELVDVGKAPGRVAHDPGRDQRAARRRAAAPGSTVVRLKGGDPFVFGRGGEEAEACIARRRAVRGRARHHERDRGARVRGHPGDAPRRVDAASRSSPATRTRPRARTDTDWDALARAGGTLVILMGAGRVGEIAKALIAGGRDADTPVAAVRWGTRPEQRTVRGDARDDRRRSASRRRARSSSARSPRSTSRWFEQRPLFGRTRRRHPRARAGERAARRGSRQLGAEVIELPAIAIEPVDVRAARPRRLRVGRVHVGERRRRVLRPRARRRRARRPRARRGVRVAAIGPGTARRARAARHPRRPRARALRRRGAARGVPDPGRRARGAARPRRVGARRAARRARARRATTVDVLAVYRTVPAAPDADDLARVRAGDGRRDHVHVVVDGHELLRRGRAARRAAAARSSRSARSRRRPRASAGLRVDAEADPHTIDGLVDGRRGSPDRSRRR